MYQIIKFCLHVHQYGRRNRFIVSVCILQIRIISSVIATGNQHAFQTSDICIAGCWNFSCQIKYLTIGNIVTEGTVFLWYLLCISLPERCIKTGIWILIQSDFENLCCIYQRMPFILHIHTAVPVFTIRDIAISAKRIQYLISFITQIVCTLNSTGFNLDDFII